MIDLKDLEYLVVVSKSGTINRAADRLGLTQPALTRRMQRLEREFDLRLLDRQPKGVRLTEIGEEFLMSSQKLLAHSRDFENEMKIRKRGKGGTIKVGIKPGLDDLFFSQSLLKFKEAHPDTVIRVSIDATPRLMRQLLNGELDFAYGALGYADEHGNEVIMSQELSFQPVMNIPLAVYCRSGHPALSSSDEGALFDYPLISPSPPLNISSNIDQAYKARGQSYKTPQITVDDFYFAAKIAAQSNYWSAVFEPLFANFDIYGDFVSFGPHEMLPPLTIGLVQRKTWTPSPWAKKLLEISMQFAKPWLLP